jgi:membrane-associated protein
MFNVTHLIELGLPLVALIIFAESGMLIGFFFPGDTLLLTVGVFAAQGKLSLAVAIPLIAFAAILGDNIGYHIGKRAGPHLFKEDSMVFRHEYIIKAEAFYEKHGSKTMLLAHFVPIVRTFVPVTAGAGKMPHITFTLFDAIGDTAWTFALIYFGYYVASKIPGVQNYVDPVLIAVVILSIVPTLYHLLKDEKIRTAIKLRFRRKPN